MLFAFQVIEAVTGVEGMHREAAMEVTTGTMHHSQSHQKLRTERFSCSVISTNASSPTPKNICSSCWWIHTLIILEITEFFNAIHHQYITWRLLVPSAARLYWSGQHLSMSKGCHHTQWHFWHTLLLGCTEAPLRKYRLFLWHVFRFSYDVVGTSVLCTLSRSEEFCAVKCERFWSSLIFIAWLELKSFTTKCFTLVFWFWVYSGKGFVAYSFNDEKYCCHCSF